MTVHAADGHVPGNCDLYVLGGGEDIAQVAAVRVLNRSTQLLRTLRRGVPLLGISSGFQVLGESFVTGDGARHEGLGLVDASTTPGTQRVTGEVTADSTLPRVGTLTGFENHLGQTRIGAQEQPLGRVTSGIGNDEDTTDGVVHGHVVCSYLHGPLLARNPKLADLLLEWALGEPLEPIQEPPEIDQLRRERSCRPVRARK